MPARDSRHGGDIDDIHQGIGRRLGPDEAGILIYIFIDIRRVLHIHKMKADARALEYFGEEAISASVHIVRCDDFVAGREQPEHRIGGGHAAGEAEAMFAVLDMGKGRLERLAGGVL